MWVFRFAISEFLGVGTENLRMRGLGLLLNYNYRGYNYRGGFAHPKS